MFFSTHHRTTRALVMTVATVGSLAVLAGCGMAATKVEADPKGPVSTTNTSDSAGLPVVSAYNIASAKPQSSYTVDIEKTTMLIGGQKTARYIYTNPAGVQYGAGMPIIAEEGQPLTITVTNKTSGDTNVHWHGLIIPNNEDGALDDIKPGATKTFTFTPQQDGTFWYHSHYRPVATQVDDGMYAPFIIESPQDKKYNVDQVLLVNDPVINGRGGGMMEVQGYEDFVNGRTGTDIAPISISGGQSVRLRFIDGSISRNQVITFPFDVNEIAIDGKNLDQPVKTRSITVIPGGRADVEFSLGGAASKTYYITNDRSAGMRIPVVYHGDSAAAAADPFVPSPVVPVSAAMVAKAPDFTMDLGEGMGGMMGGSGMQWTINGKVFPDTGTFNVKVGQPYKVRFINRGMEDIAHPMHIHGVEFQVADIGGKPTGDNTFYDTYDMSYGTYTDVVVTFTKPGLWVVHCHILQHEDAGMMMSFTAS